MFKLWWAGEAGWRQNRAHLLIAAISLLLLVSVQSAFSAVFALAIVGSLLLRIVVWNFSR